MREGEGDGKERWGGRRREKGEYREESIRRGSQKLMGASHTYMFLTVNF